MQLDPVEIQFDGRRPWWTLRNLYWPERRWVALAMLTYLLKASPVWVIPVITANIIDTVVHHQQDGMRSLWLNTLTGVGFIVLNIPAAMLYVSLLSRAVRNVEARLRSALVRRLQILSISYHSRVNTASLQTKVLRDVESVQMLSQQMVDIGQMAVVSILVSLAVTAWRMPVFLPVFILLVPLVALIRRSMSGRMQERNEILRKQLENMSAQVLGMIQLIPITRAHAVENAEITRVESQFSHVRRAARSSDKTAGLFGAIAWVIFMLFSLAGLAVGAWLTYRGVLPLTAGDFFLLTGYFTLITNSVMQLNAMLPIVARGFDGLRSIGEVLDCPDIEDNRGKKAITQVRGEFVFEHVTFHYDHAGDVPAALRDLNFRINAGETVGIIGQSGSGKSTLASLITGFHRPTTGRILLDGTDVNTIDFRTFRQRLAVVSQQTILFNGTLRENIVYGASRVSDEELQAAIHDANAAEFICELPRGLDTEIGQNGVQLSGGQRQRIAIARALLRDPRVLILDEATSSLDVGSEAVVQRALKLLMAGRTTFIITHRPAILENAHRIFTLDHGVLREQQVKEHYVPIPALN